MRHRILITILSSATCHFAAAQQSADGNVVFERACAACHAGAGVDNAPALAVMRELSPASILNSLTNGTMQAQGSTLTADERTAVAEFVGGQAMQAAADTGNACVESPPMANVLADSDWNGWGHGVTNNRFAAAGGLTAADLPRLELKWAFGYADVNAARAPPALVGGRLFVTSENGEVHALDPGTGCAHWTYTAISGVRTAIAIGPYTRPDGAQGHAAFFGDRAANAYALDANTGRLLWVRKIDDHAGAAITGSLTVHAGRVYVPVQGLNEEGRGGVNNYECCTFRGSLTSLDANTGEVVWKSYTIEAPQPRATNAAGVQMWGPAGGGIWSPATVDAARGLVYVATGNGYADPPQPTTDAVLALDIDTGEHVWVNQLLAYDQWTMGCGPQNPDNPACPAALGPDYDFSAPPALVSAGDRDLLILPQKSGLAYALDPDAQGRLVWQYRIGQGSGLGGQWGGGFDANNAYIGVSDLVTQNPGGLHAIDIETGERVWYAPPQPLLCRPGRGCRAAQGGPVTVIPGAVLSGSVDGGMRAYSTGDGTILWQFDTNREFATVNGVAARGGGMDAAGPIVAGGMLFFNAGYGGLVGTPGNVLLAFGLE